MELVFVSLAFLYRLAFYGPQKQFAVTVGELQLGSKVLVEPPPDSVANRTITGRDPSLAANSNLGSDGRRIDWDTCQILEVLMLIARHHFNHGIGGVAVVAAHRGLKWIVIFAVNRDVSLANPLDFRVVGVTRV